MAVEGEAAVWWSGAISQAPPSWKGFDPPASGKLLQKKIRVPAPFVGPQAGSQF